MVEKHKINLSLVVDNLLDMLKNYNERDKIMRLVCYTSKLVSSLTNNKTCATLSCQLSECRTVLRLFDDLPMLSYSLSYGLGKKEPDLYMQVCGVIVNMLDQLYYPIEHVAWAADKGLLKVHSEPWWMASNVCWAFSLYFKIARSLRYLSLLHDHSKHLDLADSVMRNEYKKNLGLQLSELLCGVRCACDLIHAIHWMPRGILWSGTLKDWHIGALGTISSVISLVESRMLDDSS